MRIDMLILLGEEQRGLGEITDAFGQTYISERWVKYRKKDTKTYLRLCTVKDCFLWWHISTT